MDGGFASPAGWYPQGGGGAMRYWDRVGWTQFTKPPRRRFAARSFHPVWGVLLGLFAVSGIMSLPERINLERAEGAGNVVGAVMLSLLVSACLAAGAVYLLRGRGPTTAAVKRKLAAQASISGHVVPVVEEEEVVHDHGPHHPRSELVEAAQVKAVSDPNTAQALVNLQQLLYTRTITEEEFQAAKSRLFGHD